MKRSAVLLAGLGMILTFSLLHPQPLTTENPINLTPQQKQYIEDHQLVYLTSDSNRTADHFVLARLYKDAENQYVIFLNYVQNDAESAVSRRLYLAEGRTTKDLDYPLSMINAELVAQHHYYQSGNGVGEYPLTETSQAYMNNSLVDETSLWRDCQWVRIPLSQRLGKTTVFGSYILKTNYPLSEAFHLNLSFIMEKPQTKLKLGIVTLIPRNWENYNYRLWLDIWKERE